MEAGVGRKLLALTYEDGGERLVEPYALRYMRRNDGEAFEYLYVWDRTGGRKGPGIKRFFHHKIEKLAVPDQTFEPQIPIELTKAGELRPGDDSIRSSRRTSRAKNVSPGGFFRQPVSRALKGVKPLRALWEAQSKD
jgi:hypothetical protein